MNAPILGAVCFLYSFFPVDPSVFSPFGPFRHSRLRRSCHLPLNKGRHWAGCIRSALSVGGIALAPLAKGRHWAGCIRSALSVGSIALAPLAKGSCHREPRRTMTEGSHVRVLHRQKRMTPNKNAAVQGCIAAFCLRIGVQQGVTALTNQRGRFRCR